MLLDRLATLVAEGSFDFVISTARDPKVEQARMQMAPPATKEQIEECEGALGAALPLSYREFLQRWNGGRLWVVYANGKQIYEALRLFGTKELMDENLWLRERHARDPQYATLLWFGETWGWYHLFDLSWGGSEPPVVGGDEHWKPKEWLSRREADSFDAFIGCLLDSDGEEFWIPNNRRGRMNHILGVLKALVVQAPWPANLPGVGWVTVNQTVQPGATSEELAAAEAALGYRLPGAVSELLTTWNGADLYRVFKDGQELWSVRLLSTADYVRGQGIVAHGGASYLVVAETVGYTFVLDPSAEESPLYAVSGDAAPLMVAPSLADFLWALKSENGRRFWVGP